MLMTARNLAILATMAAAALLAPLGFAGSTVAINIQTQTVTPIAAGFSGYNAPQPRNGVEYYDPKFVAAVTPLKPGWLRFPGGTSSMAFDWNPANSTGGHIDISWMNSLITGNPPEVTGQSASILTVSQQLTQAKGGVWLSDFATFTKALGANAIICFNGYTDTNPGSSTQMVQAAQSAGLNVLEWELDNEAYVYPLIFPTAATYAGAVYNPYFTGISSAEPDPIVGLSMGTNGIYTNWNSQLSAYAPRYWNAVSIHFYPITTIQSLSNTIQTLNGILAYGTGDYINSYVDPLIGSDTPIFITEFDCCSQDNNKFLTFIYNGVFMAEYIARMSVVPNVKGIGVNSLYTDNYDYHGVIQSVDDYESYLLGQVAANPNFSTDTATDPNTPFQFYTSAPGLALTVANQAINNSTQAWPTSVTGGPMVAIQGYDGNPIPAIYAQAYEGIDGSHYLLITNKSSATCVTTIQVNGVHVSGAMSITTVSSPSSSAANTAQAQNNVQIQTSTSVNPISLGPYSVTVLNW
jgi:hypothetical protein